MKLPVFLAGAALLSLTCSLLILFSGSEAPLHSKKTTGSQINPVSLANYIVDKGKSGWPADNAFASLLASAPNVLSATDTANRDQLNEFAIPVLPKKTSYTIAFLGDSMIDTLGPTVGDLGKTLKSNFPKINFKIINHGAGATDMEYGYERLNNGYTYLGQNRPAVLAENPDIVVIESFAYNHWSNTQGDLDRQWLTIAGMIDEIKRHNKDTAIVLAASIAPYCPTYTDGSVNLPPERKTSQCATVKAYLQNIVNFATSQKYPLINAYRSSIKNQEGNPLYINGSDHIHPSDEGRELFAELSTRVISMIIPQ